jgi:hypothetical protein
VNSTLSRHYQTCSMTTSIFRAELRASAPRHCRVGNPLPSTNDKHVRGSPVRDLACLNSCFALQQSNLQRVNKRLTRGHNPFALKLLSRRPQPRITGDISRRCQAGSFALRNSPCRRIGGSGVVQIHALHLAGKRAYSSRKDKPVTTRNLHGRKLIKNTNRMFDLAGRDRPQTHAELRDVVCSPRSGTTKGAAFPVRAGISPLESDFESAGIGRTCPCVPGILSQQRAHGRPANKHGRR